MNGTNTAIDVIEIRAVKNGYVITAFMEGYRRDLSALALTGYVTRVVEIREDDRSNNAAAAKIGAVIEQLLDDHTISKQGLIPPARALP